MCDVDLRKAEDGQRAWLDRHISDNLGTREALLKCSEKLGLGDDIYRMITNVPYGSILNLGILDFEQIQVLDLAYCVLME